MSLVRDFLMHPKDFPEAQIFVGGPSEVGRETDVGRHIIRNVNINTFFWVMNQSSDLSVASRLERPLCKCKMPLTPACALVNSRSRPLALSLLVILDLIAFSDLGHDSDLHVFSNVVTMSPILA